MTAPLVPCETCARHLHADSARCPFCHAARTPQELAYVALPRMSRAALAALGAALAVVPVTALVGLSDDADAQTPPGTMRPMYGMPPSRLHPPPLRGVDAGAAFLDASVPRDAAPSDASPSDAAPSDAARLDVIHRHPRPPHEDPIPVPLYGISPKPAD